MTPPAPRVRFAPSPTGPLHMGGVRTALYNYLFAKKHGGDFILRIEDTDQFRYVAGAEQYIIDSLKWCGIIPNEGVGFGDGPHIPYRQSERKGIYRSFAERLVESGFAYYAFDTEQELEEKRKQAEAEKSAFSYNGSTRNSLRNSLTLSAEETENVLHSGAAYVIRLKVPVGEEIRLTDMIRGEVVVQSDQIDDKVLFKSDGMPTYHLANVVDDYLMKITHVIRGEEWLPSTPLHVLLYRFFGWEESMPAFAHLPLLLKPDGNGKLSKRDGDRLGFPVFPLNWKDPETGEESSGYRERGYLPSAFVNMLALLGWNSGSEKEIFTLEELVEQFDIARVHKAGAKFDPEKAKWFNEQHLRRLPFDELTVQLRDDVINAFNLKEGDAKLKASYLEGVVRLMIERVQFRHEIVEKGNYFFIPPVDFDQQVIQKKWKQEFVSFFDELKNEITGLKDFSSTEIESLFKSTAEKHSIKPGSVLQLLRVLVSGQSGGPDLFGMLALLGAEETSSRLGAGLKAAQEMAAVKS